jgi:DHA1 family inner membrane transport protein
MRNIALALLSYLFMLAGIMAVFSYVATFLATYTGLAGTSFTLMLALYGVSDLVGNLLLSRRVPDQLDNIFKALLSVLAFSLPLSRSLANQFGWYLWWWPPSAVVMQVPVC